MPSAESWYLVGQTLLKMLDNTGHYYMINTHTSSMEHTLVSAQKDLIWLVHRNETYFPFWMLEIGACIATGLTTGVRIPAGVQFFSSSQLLDRLRAHSASYPMGIGRFPPGEKRPGRQANYWHLSNAEVKNGEAIPPLPHMSSWCNG
jgi:hypothetical protein